MTQATRQSQAENYYRAIHDGLSRNWRGGSVSVYYDPRDRTYKAAAGGFTGWSLIEVAPNVSLDQFVPAGDLPAADQFVAMCIDCFGTDVPTEIAHAV